MTIKILPESIANRISAGEVIFRPSSALKELVENSIDSGAKLIEVFIEDAGKTIITVRDDGSGMNKKDLELCIERHATSKLNDLFNISTFGFRGEALPSIGAISRLCITSKHENDQAWTISIEGGNKSLLEPATLKQGTLIEVKDLFYATPARLKFLKSNYTESSHCISTLRELAISHSHISFKLIENNKEIFNYKAGTFEERITEIFTEEKNHLIKIESDQEQWALKGFISVPTYNHSTTASQHLFVNERPVKDKTLSLAIKSAYLDLIPGGRHPSVILFLNLPYEEVDVNVHPAKLEVRFRNSQGIKTFIEKNIRNSLQIPKANIYPTRDYSYKPAPNYSSNLAVAEPVRNYSPNYVPEIVQEVPLQESLVPSEETYALGNAKAQLCTRYIISENENGMVIIDQHAAHERIVFEKLKEQIINGKLESQQLLIPEVISLLPEKANVLLSKKELFYQLGLFFDKLGKESIVVLSIPKLLIGCDIIKLINDIAEEILLIDDELSLKNNLQKICATMACHSSIRSGKNLSQQEMNALLRQMESTSFIEQCSHGRPTYINFSFKKLEELFHRK